MKVAPHTVLAQLTAESTRLHDLCNGLHALGQHDAADRVREAGKSVALAISAYARTRTAPEVLS